MSDSLEEKHTRKCNTSNLTVPSRGQVWAEGLADWTPLREARRALRL